jgi:hypothetical protein
MYYAAQESGMNGGAQEVRATSHKGGRQENCPRGHNMIGHSFQEAFTRISSNWSPHKHGGMRRIHMWLLMDEKKSYVACIGLPWHQMTTEVLVWK